jgi:hypothetical protein
MKSGRRGNLIRSLNVIDEIASPSDFVEMDSQ